MDNKIKFTAYCLGDPIGRNVNVQTLEEFARVLQCAEFDTVYKISVSIQENVAPGAGVTEKNTVMSYYIADEIKTVSGVGADFEKRFGHIFPTPPQGNKHAIITGYRPHTVIGMRISENTVPRTNLGYDIVIHELNKQYDKVLNRKLHQIYPCIRRQIPVKLRNFVIRQKQR